MKEKRLGWLEYKEAWWEIALIWGYRLALLSYLIATTVTTLK